MPRKYSMERRSAIVDETRQRIIDATVALHNEKGVLATTTQDIAARADVSLGTVYRHFPTIEDLIPACGGRNMDLNPPPAPSVFEHLESPAERLHALFQALYAHFEVADRAYFVGYAESPQLPVLQDIMGQMDRYLRSLATAALEPFAPSALTRNFTVAMADYHAWLAFRRAGLSTGTAADVATRMVVDQLSREEAAGR